MFQVEERIARVYEHSHGEVGVFRAFVGDCGLEYRCVSVNNLTSEDLRRLADKLDEVNGLKRKENT